jgi:type III pantothenate kinase
MKQEARSTPKVIATGGLAKTIAPETKSMAIVDEMLTLEGLRIIYNKNI